MRKKVLIVSLEGVTRVTPVEKLLVAKGFQAVRVVGLKNALYRLDNEVFSAILCEDDAEGTIQKELSREIDTRPFACTTPVIVTGPHPEPKTRALLTSILDQYFRLGSDPELLADYIEETHELRKKKAKRGFLGRVSVPRILYGAAQFEMDGAVVVEKAEEKCVIYVEKGCVVFASSNRDENRFGEFLVSRGVITKEQLDASLRNLGKTGKRLGRILVEEGHIKPQILQTLLQSQVKHIVFNVFDWNDGEFFVLPDERFTPGEAVSHFEIAPLILEGVQFKFREEDLSREFEPFDIKVSLALPMEECRRRIRLGKNELDFLRLIGDGRPIADLMNLNSFSRVESLQMLYSFRVLGLLAFERRAVPAPPASVAEEERKEVIRELFSSLGKGAQLRVDAPPPTQVPLPPPRPRRARKVAYFFTGAGAVMAVLALVWIYLVERGLVSIEIDRPASVEDRRDDAVAEAVPIHTPPQALATSTPLQTAEVPLVEIAAPSPEPTAAKPTQPPAQAIPLPTPRMEPTPDLLAMARRQRREGNIERALVLYRNHTRANPYDAAARVETGDILIDLDRVGEAEREYREAIRIDPGEAGSYLGLGTIYLLREDTVNARASYERYLARVPKTASNQARILEVRRILEQLGR